MFKEKVWGGNDLKEEFGYKFEGDNIGECWAISAHKDGVTKVKSGKYAGYDLNVLWREHYGLFGQNKSESRFPLLTKIIDAKDNLSIQVHPNNAVAKKYDEFGKTESWYVIKAGEHSEIVVGHKAKNHEELLKMIENNEWNNLLNKRKIKSGDFFHIPAGTIHAICKDTIILEVQQSSDITFRLYDYERLMDGEKRKLHLDNAIEVITYGDISCPYIKKDVLDKGVVEKLTNNEVYSLFKVSIDGEAEFIKENGFLMVSIIHGVGKIDEIPLIKGDHLIIPYNYGGFTIEGNLDFIIASPQNYD